MSDNGPNHVEQRFADHEARLASIEAVGATTVESLRAVASDVASLRTHFDEKLDRMAADATASQKSKPSVVIGAFSLGLSFLAASGAIIVLAISNSTGPLEAKQEATDELAKLMLSAQHEHFEMDGHPEALAKHKESDRRINDLVRDVLTIQNAEGGVWTKRDAERSEDMTIAEQRIVRQRLREAERRIAVLFAVKDYPRNETTQATDGRSTSALLHHGQRRLHD